MMAEQNQSAQMRSVRVLLLCEIIINTSLCCLIMASKVVVGNCSTRLACLALAYAVEMRLMISECHITEIKQT